MSSVISAEQNLSHETADQQSTEVPINDDREQTACSCISDNPIVQEIMEKNSLTQCLIQANEGEMDTFQQPLSAEEKLYAINTQPIIKETENEVANKKEEINILITEENIGVNNQDIKTLISEDEQINLSQFKLTR